jgi:hypothetical protein
LFGLTLFSCPQIGKHCNSRGFEIEIRIPEPSNRVISPS